jgi:hypothetical protein
MQTSDLVHFRLPQTHVQMTAQLFRQEALDHQSNRLFGESYKRSRYYDDGLVKESRDHYLYPEAGQIPEPKS